MSESPQSLQRDLDLCNEHRELADLLIEHGCVPAGEDRPLFRALIEREAQTIRDVMIKPVRHDGTTPAAE